jgi:hypothetical protein
MRSLGQLLGYAEVPFMAWASPDNYPKTGERKHNQERLDRHQCQTIEKECVQFDAPK